MKPIHEAHILENACPHCKAQTRYNVHQFYCQERDLGTFDEPCLTEDWCNCPLMKDFNPHSQNKKAPH